MRTIGLEMSFPLLPLNYCRLTHGWLPGFKGIFSREQGFGETDEDFGPVKGKAVTSRQMCSLAFRVSAWNSPNFPLEPRPLLLNP